MEVCIICKEEKIRFIRPNKKKETNHDFNKRQTCGKKICHTILRDRTRWAKAMMGFTEEDRFCIVCGAVKQQRIRPSGLYEGLVEMLGRATCSSTCLTLYRITRVYRAPLIMIPTKQSTALNSFLY